MPNRQTSSSKKMPLQELGFPADVLEDLIAEDLAACQKAVIVQNIQTAIWSIKKKLHTQTCAPPSLLCSYPMQKITGRYSTIFAGLKSPNFMAPTLSNYGLPILNTANIGISRTNSPVSYCMKTRGKPIPRHITAWREQSTSKIICLEVIRPMIFLPTSLSPKMPSIIEAMWPMTHTVRPMSCFLSSWMNYIHQRSWMQYPVMTAKDFVMYASIFASDKIFFKTARNVLQVHCTSMIETIPKRNSPSASKNRDTCNAIMLKNPYSKKYAVRIFFCKKDQNPISACKVFAGI